MRGWPSPRGRSRTIRARDTRDSGVLAYGWRGPLFVQPLPRDVFGGDAGRGAVPTAEASDGEDSEDGDDKVKWKEPVKVPTGHLAPPKLTMQPVDVKTVMN